MSHNIPEQPPYLVQSPLYVMDGCQDVEPMSLEGSNLHFFSDADFDCLTHLDDGLPNGSETVLVPVSTAALRCALSNRETSSSEVTLSMDVDSVTKALEHNTNPISDTFNQETDLNTFQSNSVSNRSNLVRDLERKLLNRPPISQLVGQGIMPPPSLSPSIYAKAKELTRIKRENSLNLCIRQRVQRKDLEDRNILPKVAQDALVFSKGKDLARAIVSNKLSTSMKNRPDKSSLINRHILPEGCLNNLEPRVMSCQAGIKRQAVESRLESKISTRPPPNHPMIHHLLHVDGSDDSKDSVFEERTSLPLAPSNSVEVPSPPPLPASPTRRVYQRQQSGRRSRGGNLKPKKQKLDQIQDSAAFKISEYRPKGSSVTDDEPSALSHDNYAAIEKILQQKRQIMELQEMKRQGYKIQLHDARDLVGDSSVLINGLQRSHDYQQCSANFQAMKLNALKQACKENGLTVSGTKNDLIHKLTENELRKTNFVNSYTNSTSSEPPLSSPNSPLSQPISNVSIHSEESDNPAPFISREDIEKLIGNCDLNTQSPEMVTDSSDPVETGGISPSLFTSTNEPLFANSSGLSHASAALVQLAMKTQVTTQERSPISSSNSGIDPLLTQILYDMPPSYLHKTASSPDIRDAQQSQSIYSHAYSSPDSGIVIDNQSGSLSSLENTPTQGAIFNQPMSFSQDDVFSTLSTPDQLPEVEGMLF